MAAVWHISLLLPCVLSIWKNTDKANSSCECFSATHMLVNGANSTGEHQGDILAYIHHELAQKEWPLITESSWNTNLCLLLTAGSNSWSPKLTLQILPDPLQCEASCEHCLRQSRASTGHCRASAVQAAFCVYMENLQPNCKHSDFRHFRHLPKWLMTILARSKWCKYRA